MKTSRLKNIVIVILLLVNAFLLFLLLSRRAGERDSNERRVEQLCTLFEKNGVAFDRALLPDEETHLSLSLERDAAREEAFASALLGTAESSDSGGGVSRFTGEYGSCSIRSGGTVTPIVPDDVAKTQAAKIKKGEDVEEYQSTEYLVKLSLSSNYDTEYARTMLDEILSCYFASFGEKYVDYYTIPNNASALDGQGSDYLEQAEILKNFKRVHH